MKKLALIIAMTTLVAIGTGCGGRVTIVKARFKPYTGGQSAGPKSASRIQSDRAFEDGLSLYRSGQYQVARPYFEQAASLCPTCWKPHFYLGLVFCKSTDWQASITCLHRGLEKAPDDKPVRSMIYLALAETYEMQGSPGQARAAFQMALSLRPDSPRAQEGLQRLGSLTQTNSE